MYKLYSANDMEPLLASDAILEDYGRKDISSMHERNLFELGEDRMLTALLLQHFYGMRLNFVPEATCWTIVPHTFWVLVSQRRRWINSTIHNMLELMKVQTMCGVCVFSMKVVVISDLLSSFLLPSGSLYLYYVVFRTAITQEYIAFSLFIVFGCLAALVTPFIFRAQWHFFFWFLIYLVGGIPVFYIYLPIYAIWHMDDLSWGQTRQVNDDDAKVDHTRQVLQHSATSLMSTSSEVLEGSSHE
jgi:chitin synthase